MCTVYRGRLHGIHQCYRPPLPSNLSPASLELQLLPERGLAILPEKAFATARTGMDIAYNRPGYCLKETWQLPE